MTTIPVRLGARSYDIVVERSYAHLPRLLNRLRLPRSLWVISHASLLRRFGPQILRPLVRAGYATHRIVVPESERAKSVQTALRIIDSLARDAVMHTPVLLAFGGGVVGDVTGFVAAMFRRGVPYVQVPTTLLAQVDSSIGGKTGVDVPFAKNLIGAFHQPRLVFNHLSMLRTLPPRQWRSGLGEVIKYGVMADAALFEFIEAHSKECVQGQPTAVRLMVERSCHIKARVVSRDERDTTGLRAQLNFGHTLGHALETATGYRRYTHGEAIAIGMACASDLSARVGWLAHSAHVRLIRLLETVGLPTRATGISIQAVKQALRFDKKFLEGKPRWVLARKIGRVAVTDDIPTAAMWDAIRQALGTRG